MPRPLDLMAVNLGGTHLIDASAGTGKTYTIAGLFLRLLLEKGMRVESILVVTYTVPATEELKIRIRDRLLQAREAFAQGVTDDGLIQGLLARVADRRWAVSTLDMALAQFDQISISTIHGFCQRMLRELAFETASPFDTELVTDQADLMAACADDFYRMRITGHEVGAFIAFCTGRKVSPEWFVRIAGLKNLSAGVTPEDTAPLRLVDLEALLANYTSAFEALSGAWPGARGEVEMLLGETDNISQVTHKLNRIPGYLDAVERFLAAGPAMLPDCACLEKFTLEAVRKAAKKGRPVPVHLAFALFSSLHKAARELESAMEGGLTALKVEFLSYLDDALGRRKQRQGLVHYDDLLVRLHRALKSAGGGALAASVKARFGAALIDEFQDTDPLQYEIFTRCFSGTCLFFIGDPKQAIYSFRGADVFTYARAASSVMEENTHTLLHNWRSDPGLIEAVNAVFSIADDPFVFDWIRFEDAMPARKPDSKVLTGLDGAPLTVWYLDAQDAAGLTVDQASQAVCRACACEIARLLKLSVDGSVRLGGARLRPGDMAVLVRTNSQARMVRDALREVNVACVLTSDENVFSTPEAFEMEALLAAIAEPHRQGLVRSALMTRIFGIDAAGLDALESREAAWEDIISTFREYHYTWERSGFTPMIRALLDTEGVRARLLGHASGERALTNVLHIAELLGKAQASGKLGVQGLRTWLAERRTSGDAGTDEYQLRLESDEDALKVMTVHKSKGLEFAVVFCPFAWDSPRQDRAEGVLFHDGAASAVLDLGTQDMENHRAQASREALAESVRLLYVALTRARNRCYVAFAQVRNAGRSAMAHLMEGGGGQSLEQGLGALVERTSGRAQVKLLPREEPRPLGREDASGHEPSERHFLSEIDRTWGMASYTSFIRGMHGDRDAADRDSLRRHADEDADGKTETARDIFSFPRGARSGTLLHEVFERLDFTAGEGAIRGVVRETLLGYGFDPAWTAAVTDMARKVLSADLAGMRLDQVENAMRLTELEFMFPLKHLTPAGLHNTLKACLPGPVPEHAPSFAFDPVKGYLRGFMDLVFYHGGKYYLIDWKSNHLGYAVEDYGGDALLASMVQDGYVMQYHLYCVALHHYLKKRQPGYSHAEHFGGVFYVYLRGVDPAKGSGYGIFRARPDEEIIEELSGVLMDSRS